MSKPTNTQPVIMHLTGEAGKRVILNSAKRVMHAHKKEIKALVWGTDYSYIMKLVKVD